MMVNGTHYFTDCECENCKQITRMTNKGFPKPIKRTKEQRLKDRIERLKLKAKEKKQPKLSELKKIVQKKVNAFIRERDKGLPCLACGKPCKDGQASHYIAQGSSGLLRYHPDNIHVTCIACNMYKHGNLIEYRIGLVKKIGVLQVEWLERNRHLIHKWTREELVKLTVEM